MLYVTITVFGFITSHPLTSRVTGVHTAAALPVSLAGCPASWNLTSALAEDEAAAGADWWPHLRLYEVSYMWYSGLACCTTVLLGSALSLVPSLRQKQHPHPDLSVPVMEVENTTSRKLCVLFMKILH